MGRDDQIEEREVLDSIFPDEITDVSDTSYRISITLDVTEREGEEAEPPILILQISYPEEYPDVAPGLEIMTPPNAPKHPHLDIQEDRSRLIEALEPSIEENMGMAMVFTLVSTLKDCAELLISERQAAIDALKEVEAAKAEEEENRKFQGTAVTRETFIKWREGFQAELQEEERRKREEKEAEEKKKKPSAREEKKLTGKQLWERGLAGKGEGDYEEDDDEGVQAGVENIKLAA
ncbi:hypothetical protein FQN54_005725 [Arachnomyces sp. PD_36]|nr:hypothetical protein FQN54_005725 [Arachnomyces sp. PD_36]